MTKKKPPPPPSASDMAAALDSALMDAMKGQPMTDKDGNIVLVKGEPFIAPPSHQVLAIMEKRVKAKEGKGGAKGDIPDDETKALIAAARKAGGAIPDVETDDL